ncbi:hypothetical protein M8C21_018675 [Ambrosia artemisiifolia]|uniref:Legumain prodomain domain-containing protein n=1 Tax=Ambrosia artemisiifolia TaxID=4212 RepID=A0AAD5C257_AMBAR|nr:hypothetical protein M8C21_018675 [Ambrosia artemisiifolia]
MTNCHLIRLILLLMTLMVVNICMSQSSTVENGTRWDVLEAATNHVHLDDDLLIREKESYAYYIWNLYNTSSRSHRFEVMNEMKKSRSILSARIDYERLDVGEDYHQCLQTTADLYMKHCGPITEDGLRHSKSMSNMCLYNEDKAMIEDAIIITCGSNNVMPYGIDVGGHPTVDVIPAPFHGSSEYCGRVSINGISRMELRSYAKSYKVMFEPLVFHEMHNKTQVCFHRNASRGLCQCKKDDWKFIRRGSREFLLSPYEHKFVDVKFNSEVFGFVTVTIKEDLLERWRCGFLVLGVVALFVDGSKDILNQNAADGVDRVLDWAMRVAAVIAIFLSSFDTLLAVAVLASFFALNFVIIPIIAPILKKKSSRWVKLRESSTKDSIAERENFIDTRFRDWVIKNLDRIVVLSDISQDDHCM